jgi:hypothetical protein
MVTLTLYLLINFYLSVHRLYLPFVKDVVGEVAPIPYADRILSLCSRLAGMFVA